MRPSLHRRFAGPKSPCTNVGDATEAASRSRARKALRNDFASVGNRRQRSPTLGRRSSRTKFGEWIRFGAIGSPCSVAKVRPIAVRIASRSLASAYVTASPGSYVSNRRRRRA